MKIRNKTAQAQPVNTINGCIKVHPGEEISIQEDEIHSYEKRRLEKFFEVTEESKPRKSRAFTPERIEVKEGGDE